MKCCIQTEYDAIIFYAISLTVFNVCYLSTVILDLPECIKVIECVYNISVNKSNIYDQYNWISKSSKSTTPHFLLILRLILTYLKQATSLITVEKSLISLKEKKKNNQVLVMQQVIEWCDYE